MICVVFVCAYIIAHVRSILCLWCHNALALVYTSIGTLKMKWCTLFLINTLLRSFSSKSIATIPSRLWEFYIYSMGTLIHSIRCLGIFIAMAFGSLCEFCNLTYYHNNQPTNYGQHHGTTSLIDFALVSHDISTYHTFHGMLFVLRIKYHS